MTLAIHQFIPSFAPRSAVGEHTLQVRALLHDLGIRSDIYVGEAKRGVERISAPFRTYGGERHAETYLLYQASTGSPMADFLLERPEPKIVNYHNITPASLFEPWEPHVGAELAAGRRQLGGLAPVTALGIGDSTYNTDELDALGYRSTTVAPILLDLAGFEAEPDPEALARLAHRDGDRDGSGGGATWLFVGRISPNKAQHDLLKALAVYRRVYDPEARLRLVGGSSSHAYLTALEGLRHALGLDDAVDILGEVSAGELSAAYRRADVFVAASDHEGFCVPLLEAMHHALPIVAYGSSAVPETLGAGGLCLPSKAPTLMAAAVHRVLSDRALAAALAEAGRRRLADFELAKTRARFTAALESLVAT